jgi:hypothetical protein
MRNIVAVRRNGVKTKIVAKPFFFWSELAYLWKDR